MKIAATIFMIAFATVLLAGGHRDPNFWLTAGQRGDELLRAKKYAEAAKVYDDAWRIGVAEYRAGNFKQAVKTFARVPGAAGVFNQGNCWLMQGRYAAAVAAYDRALGMRPGWVEAEENRDLALARQKLLEDSGRDAATEGSDAEKPDDIVFDQKGSDPHAKPIELTEAKMSDEQLRAIWLRRVQTTPTDFLRAKFAWQAGKAGAR